MDIADCSTRLMIDTDPSHPQPLCLCDRHLTELGICDTEMTVAYEVKPGSSVRKPRRK